LAAILLLAHFKAHGNPSFLRTLNISCLVSRAESVLEVDEASNALLEALNPLESLQMKGSGGKTFQTILNYYGAALRKLNISNSISSTLSNEHIGELRGKCSKLQHVVIRIPKANNDIQEVNICHLLGSLPFLKQLSIEIERPTSTQMPRVLDAG